MNFTSKKPILRVGFCDLDAARYAVMNWHYSKSMPAGRLLKFGAWENNKFVGCVIFGRGAIHNIGKPFGVHQSAACELLRVAFRQHKTPISRILGICIRMLKMQNKNMQVIVSYADSAEGHHGGIYQATNWTYVGAIARSHIMLKGKMTHPRTIQSMYGTQAIAWLRKNVDANAHYAESHQKYKYVLPLTHQMAHKVLPMAKPYPKRATSIDNDAAAFQAAEGGANPTVALQSISSGTAEDTDA